MTAFKRKFQAGHCNLTNPRWNLGGLRGELAKRLGKLLDAAAKGFAYGVLHR